MREIRLAEVGHQLYAQHLGRADGDVAVSRKVTEILHGEYSGRQRDLRAGRFDPVAENRVDVDRGAVGDNDLFKETQQHNQQAVARTPEIEIMRFGELPEQTVAALNRAGHQLGKERDEQRIAEKIGFGLRPTLVDVDHVAQRLEGEEADAHRQQNIHLRQTQRKAQCAAHAVQNVDEHAGIFEIAEHAEVEDDAADEHRFARLRLCNAGNRQRADVGDEGACGHQQRVFRVPIHIEVIAAQQQPDPADFPRQNEVKQRDDREEDQIRKRIEYHAFTFEKQNAKSI